ncbi:uncharacterized protein LOC118102293 [Hippoglossus stenolepis]|uniref:uncharacterized protein LOC118102293 n=1 Tax=Hippoglossus stenolepis TaxID=195615 RepID=UPI001FAEE6B7|nr:uncharacterized protein LOC118102293 [Hippoglossus stenolepis]
MALGSSLVFVLLLSVWLTAKCDQIPSEVCMECRDRYFLIAVDLSFAGNEARFEAIDGTGVYPITKQYAAVCGYSVSVLHLKGNVELRASYFSCHTDNKDDEFFTFSFNLVVNHEGEDVTYALKKTCSPTLPWSPREVTCEANYMEVSVRSDVACPTGTKTDDWNAAVQTAYASANSDWQVMFQKVEEPLKPMELSEARTQGYVFDLTEGRLVFRTPYGQPESFNTEVNGVPVEVVHATLFSRQSWVVLMVDLVAACSMSEGSYDDAGYMVWETPEVLNPYVSGLTNTRVSVGISGELLEQSVAEESGFIVEKHNGSVEISIPYNAEGGYRKSFVSGDLNEYYIFHLYLEQIAVDEDHVDTRLRFHRTLATPLLPRPVFTENRTVLEERVFTIYLGDVPEDVEVSAVQLNEHKHIYKFGHESGHSITKVVHPNNTHGYTLKVPFDDPAVIKKFSKEDEAMKHILEVNYTLTVLPENETFFHLTSVLALSDITPPEFDAVCSESGISFKLDHRPFDYLWHISIGSDLLSPELATQHGYIMTNDSQSLLLEVPLFTHGYVYEDVALKGFLGTFEILIQYQGTSEVQSSTVKTCPFSTAEFVLCSTDGKMTVVADLSLAISSGGIPARSNLLNTHCGPKEADDTRALFSFPLNSCGSIIKLGKEYVTYENEISFSRKVNLQKNPSDSSNEIDRVTVQCTYPLAGLYRLFSFYKFVSDAAGVGNIVHSSLLTEVLQKPTLEFDTVLQTPVPATRRNRPVLVKLGHRLKVPTHLQYLQSLFKVE